MNDALKNTVGYKKIKNWLESKSITPFKFQEETWQNILLYNSGLVNAPTGCGKTYSVFLGAVIQFINQHPTNYTSLKNNGLQLLWISPLRALATDIAKAMSIALQELEIPWRVAVRNGDTPSNERQKQKQQNPEILIITPESLHLILAQKNHDYLFETLSIVAVDEWHELMGSKRGVQLELALSYIIYKKNFYQNSNNKSLSLSVFGISATIGNLQEAMDVLLYPLLPYQQQFYLVKGGFGVELYEESKTSISHSNSKKIKVETIIPNEVDKYPWAGHLGLKLAKDILPIIQNSTTTLIFINTRGMSERWYQTLLDIEPQLAGTIALHHGSIEKETREWIENALHQQKLKAVICTASLDLGVDFRPVDSVIQVGSPKGVSRFLQRAGRSGHAPGEISKIYFLPTHSLEIIECIALQQAINLQVAESKPPLFLCFDVLLQFLCTLAVGSGFNEIEAFKIVQQTFCFNEITTHEWQELILHLTHGGKAFEQYDEYKKLEKIGDKYHIKDRRQAFRHRLHIGTIVSDAMLKVKLQNGKYLGVIEEWFISKLDEGDSFIIGGRNVALVQIKDMTVTVKPSTNKKAIIPSWMGGRMSLSGNLGELLRDVFNQLKTNSLDNLSETKALQPLLQLQQSLSHIPSTNEILIEHFTSKDGYHLLVYLFEGRQIHEAISAIVAMRLSRIETNSFSIAMNDYGFELLSDKPIEIAEEVYKQLFTTKDLYADIMQSVNSVEMAKRKFRDIAVIGGLIFQGMPGEGKKARHLQSSASLIFNVLNEFDKDNILLKQAYQEILDIQMDEARLRQSLERITKSNFIIKHPNQFTPLSFPIIADGLNRNNLSNEKLEERILRMQQQLTKNT